MSEKIKSNWWNNNVENRMEEFKRWTGDYNKPTKNYCRKHIIDKQYKEVLDCGCGLATEYYGFKHDQYEIDYTGLDSCKYLVELNRSNGLKMVEADLEVDLPVEDNSYDCVYCQEVLEHLLGYEVTINNFIRVAKKEILIIWFIKPIEGEDLIDYWPAEDLYHNRYNMEKLEAFILSNPKVKSLSWTDINEKECVLHIVLK